MNLTIDPEHVVRACETFLEKLSYTDSRWLILLDDPDRSSNRLIKSLFNWMKKEIKDLQNTESEESQDKIDAFDADSVHNLHS